MFGMMEGVGVGGGRTDWMDRFGSAEEEVVIREESESETESETYLHCGIQQCTTLISNKVKRPRLINLFDQLKRKAITE